MPKQKTVGIFGGGRWGTSLAEKLSQNSRVKLYCRDLNPADYKKVGELEYFRGMEALQDSDLFVMAVPSFAVRDVASRFQPFYSGQPIVGLSKGIEEKTGLLPGQIIEAVFGKTKYGHLSGPSFAGEVSRGLPTMLSLGLADLQHQEDFKNIVGLEGLKIQIIQDLIGVQLGGALKNVIAIATGMSDALNYGENCRAMLIVRGLQEMILLGKKLGAKEETFFGPAGLADLILTAASSQSRNYRLGVQFAQNYQSEIGEFVKNDTFEGAATAAGAAFLAKRLNLKMPVIGGVHEVIYKNKNPREFLKAVQENDLC